MNYRPSIPREFEPGRVWSLWEMMLKKAALEFGRGLADLQMLESACRVVRKQHPEIIFDPSGSVAPQLLAAFGNLKRICIEADLDSVLPQIDRCGQILTEHVKIEDAVSVCHNLKNRIIDELENEYYLQVDRQNVKYYGNENLFGGTVKKKFEPAAYDIKNAGNCLCVYQPTACVFHLMRSMEVALAILGKRLKMKIGPKDTLGKILNDMTPKINAMPEKTAAQKAKREKWAEARTNLFHVKQAWRDNSMHGKTRYSQQHAHEIFDAVRVFMVHLASL